jgi:hypothetical protein
VSNEVELTPQDEAKRLIENAAEIAKQKEALIAVLRQNRTDITVALVALGAEARSVGRPQGKRTRKPKGPEAINAQ